MQTFGSYFRTLRLQAGLSQDELAEGIVTKGMVSQIEGGKSYPSDLVLTRLAKRMQAPLDTLLAHRETDQAHQGVLKQAELLMEQGEWKQAFSLLNQCRKHPHPNWSGYDIGHSIISCLRQFGYHRHARHVLEELLIRALWERNAAELVRIYTALGHHAWEVDNKPDVALEEWRRAWRELGSLPRKPNIARHGLHVCLQLAEAHAFFGEYPLALFYYSQGEQWMRLSKGANRQVATLYMGYAALYLQTAQFRKVDGALKKADACYQQTDHPCGRLMVRIRQATLWRKKGKGERASQVLASCEEDVHRFGDEDVQAAFLLEQAHVQLLCGELESAKTSAERALEHFGSQRQAGDLLDLYRLLGAIAKQGCDYKKADLWAQKVGEHLQDHLEKRGYDLGAGE
jgi:transcriptional regulator with XRE-family HTH domain